MFYHCFMYGKRELTSLWAYFRRWSSDLWHS